MDAKQTGWWEIIPHPALPQVEPPSAPRPPSIWIDTAPGNRDNVVETFNNGGAMATVNFSVPDEVKKAFNQAFAGENKSAVLTRLMRQAVEERERQKRRAAAIEALLKLRGRTRPAHCPGLTTSRACTQSAWSTSYPVRAGRARRASPAASSFPPGIAWRRTATGSQLHLYAATGRSAVRPVAGSSTRQPPLP